MSIRNFIFLLSLAFTSAQCLAKIYYSKNEALELAFGKGVVIEVMSLFPDPSEMTKIQSIARQNLDSGMFSFYVGKSADKVLGYAAIETSTVRTKPETLMIVLTPDGQVRNVYTLAFHEPPEYQPPDHWYDLFIKRSVDDMDFNKGIQGISGATLSTRSALTSVRKVMAFYQIMLQEKSAK